MRTFVRKGASIGANATILCGLEIGAYSMIGAGSVVTNNVLAYAIMMGNPARQTGWISQAGIKLDFNDEGTASCSKTGRLYKLKNGFVDPA